MRKLAIAATAILYLFATATHAQYPVKSEKAEKLITPALMQNYINVLASDANLGRNTPSPGLDSAANFISVAFKKENILPFGDRYFQPVQMTKIDVANAQLDYTQNGEKKSLELKKDFVPHSRTTEGKISGEPIFVGYGVTAPERGYDDYAGMDVKGKIVVMISGTPWLSTSRKVYDTTASFKYANERSKVPNAINHGAAGIIIAYPGKSPIEMFSKIYWPAIDRKPFMDSTDTRSSGGPYAAIVYVANENAVNELLGGGDALKNADQELFTTKVPHSRALTSLSIDMDVQLKREDNFSNNVIAYIEGADPVLKNEVLIIGAHYDHVGYKKEHKEGEDYIMNGADDNASGTAGVMAVAKAFQALDVKPKRSVLFVLFVGEEKGLLGSKYYVNHPVIPLKNTVAMLNMDMISRNSPDTLILEGASVSPDITSIIETANKKIGFKLKSDDHFSGGSDHYTFYQKNIPMIFFFTGLHKDYHQVGDNPNTINAQKAARVARLVFRTALFIANDDQHYTLKKDLK